MQSWTKIYEYTATLLKFEKLQGYDGHGKFGNILDYWGYGTHNELCMACD